MKRIIIFSILALSFASARAQLSSPYVETGTLVINNSGFRAASLRTTPLTRPTPMHTESGAVNATFPTRFVVARVDLGPTNTWAVANGWTTAANSVLTGGVAATPATGCAAYSEAGAAAGTWRLPTQREMNLIVIARFELAATPGYTQLGTNRTYWTSTQVNATQAWAMTMTAISMYPRDKTIGLYVRCVRDL